MGQVVAFPIWQVVTHVDCRLPGEPIALVDPRGRRVPVQEVLRRRLIAPRDPRAPVRHEALVAAGSRLYLLRCPEGLDTWQVLPL